MHPSELNWHTGHKVDLLVPSTDGASWSVGTARVLKAPPRRVLLQTIGAFSPVVCAEPRLTHGALIIKPRTIEQTDCGQPVITAHGAIEFDVLWADGEPTMHLACSPASPLSGVFVNPTVQATLWDHMNPEDMTALAEDLLREDRQVSVVVGSFGLRSFFALQGGSKNDWAAIHEVPRPIVSWAEQQRALAGRRGVVGENHSVNA